MANRVLRDTTDSDPVNRLTEKAEILFYRLFMVADDFGIHPATPSLVKSAVFPLYDGSKEYERDQFNSVELKSWINELEEKGLIICYEVKNKWYLQIVNFNQRLRRMKSKYPQPEQVNKSADNCQPETETRNKKQNPKQETESENEIGDLIKKKKADFIEKFKNLGLDQEQEFTREMGNAFVHYWCEANAKGKFRWEGEKFFDMKRRWGTWKKNEKKFNNGKFTNTNNQKRDELNNLKGLTSAILSGDKTPKG